MKEKQSKEGKEERKGAVKVNLRRSQRISLAGSFSNLKPGGAEQSAHSVPGAPPLRALFRMERGEEMGLCPPQELWGCRGKSPLCPGGGKATWTGAPSAKPREGRKEERKERKQEGGWRDSWQCFERDAIKKIGKGWSRTEDLCLPVVSVFHTHFMWTYVDVYSWSCW